MKKLYELRIERNYNPILDQDVIKSFELLGFPYDEHNNLKFKVLNKDDIYEKTFYREERIKFPKIKEQILKDKYNIKITRDVNKADYIINNKKNFNIYKTYAYGIFITIENFRKIILDHDKSSSQSFKDKVAHILKNCNLDDILKIGMYGNFYRSPRNILIDLILDRDVDTVLNANHIYYIKENLIANYNNAFIKDIVLDETLMDIITDEQVTIDNNTYYELDRLLNSDNDKDHMVALETMTNINFNTGGDILVYLYNKYRDNKLKYLKNWNSVNIKAFRSKMDKYYVTYYSRTMYNVLKENNLLTNFIFNIYLQDVLNRSIDLNLKLVNHNVIIDNSMNSDFVNLRT